MLESRLAGKYRGAADEGDPGLAEPKSSDDESDSHASRRSRKEEIVANLESMNCASPTGNDNTSSGGEVSVRYDDRGQLKTNYRNSGGTQNDENSGIMQQTLQSDAENSSMPRSKFVNASPREPSVSDSEENDEVSSRASNKSNRVKVDRRSKEVRKASIAWMH